MPYVPRPDPPPLRPASDRLALVEGDYRLSWSAFEDRVARLAGGLAARGVAPGDRVAMVSHNSARFVEFFYACFWAGAVAVPLNTRWAGPELAYALEDSGTKVSAPMESRPPSEALREACGLTHCLLPTRRGAGRLGKLRPWPRRPAR